jgi:hypothetical protein
MRLNIFAGSQCQGPCIIETLAIPLSWYVQHHFKVELTRDCKFEESKVEVAEVTHSNRDRKSICNIINSSNCSCFWFSISSFNLLPASMPQVATFSDNVWWIMSYPRLEGSELKNKWCSLPLLYISSAEVGRMSSPLGRPPVTGKSFFFVRACVRALEC